jgi:hypothetical protein
MATFALIVRRVDGASFEVRVQQSDTVATLAVRISSHLNMPLAGLRVCFNGTLCRDGSASLASIGVTARHFVVALAQKADALRLSWMAASGGDVPLGAVRAGWEGDGTALYAARAAHGGGAHPGKLAQPLGGVRAGYGGTEVCASSYQALCATDARGRPWVEYHRLAEGRNVCSSLPTAPVVLGGAPPTGALAAGYEADGTRLYACMATDPGGGLCPGKMQLPAWTACSVGWGGSERQLSPCRALCVPAGTAAPRDDTAPPVPVPTLRRHLSSIEELLRWSPGTLHQRKHCATLVPEACSDNRAC